MFGCDQGIFSKMRISFLTPMFILFKFVSTNQGWNAKTGAVCEKISSGIVSMRGFICVKLLSLFI